MDIIKSDTSEISAQAASAILAKAKELLLKGKEHVVLALPGGRSAEGIYAEFSKSKDKVWKKIHIFMLDERIVPLTSKDSNFRLIKESFADALIHKGLLPKENIHPITIDAKKQDFGASDYTNELKDYGGKFDIALVASGEDGHIAALFPEHKALSIPGRKFIAIDDAPKLPSMRITSSVELLHDTGYVVLLFIGESKLNAYRRFNDKLIPIIYCPAKLVAKSKHATLCTDILDDQR